MSQEEKFSRAPAGAMLAISSALVMVIGVASYQNGQAREAANRELQISQQLSDATGDLLSMLKDAETGQRGYLLTGREVYLAPYNSAVASIPGIVNGLRLFATSRPEELQRVAALEAVVNAKLKELAQTVEVRRAQGIGPALEIVDSDRGKALMDDIRTRSAAIRDIASRRSADYSAAAEKSAQRLRLVSTFGSFILFVFLAVSAWAIFGGMTHRENLYREAFANAELLRVTLSSIGDGVIATDAAARISFINPVAQKLTGWPGAEALGVPIQEVFQVVNETTRAPLNNPLATALATGGIVELANHAVLLARNGLEIPVDDSGAPIRDKHGVVQGAVLVFRDISARRRTERQLKESNEQLTEFVGAAAHDLRSPLNTVSSIAQMMAVRFQSQIGSEDNEMLGFIIKGAARMLRLLDDLLAYAQAGHFDLEEGERTSLDHALETVVENLRSDIASTQAEITAEGLPVVAVSETHVVQLLQNLIGNALKYRSEAVPAIRISCERQGSEWLLGVKDNGIGIDRQYTSEIFKPFKRLHADDRPGSGIGLATCRKIVNGYGGQIWVESEPGKGSTFFVTLPSAESHSANNAALGQEAG